MSEAEIDALFEQWKAAVAARDVEGVAALVADDCEFWSNAAPPMRGKDAVRATLAEFYRRFEHRQEFERHELVVRGDLAFARGIEDNVLHPVDGGAEIRHRQRAFMVIRREADGRWRFARGMTNQLPPETPPTAPAGRAG
jgi:uncharacterized protein (TIGR02246 family)